MWLSSQMQSLEQELSGVGSGQATLYHQTQVLLCQAFHRILGLTLITPSVYALIQAMGTL
jgi:hypothetical protein